VWELNAYAHRCTFVVPTRALNQRMDLAAVGGAAPVPVRPAGSVVSHDPAPLRTPRP